MSVITTDVSKSWHAENVEYKQNVIKFCSFRIK